MSMTDTPLSNAQRDAHAYLEALLRAYGLESLSSWAYEQVVAGNSPEMVGQLLWERPEFRTRFEPIFYRQQNGLPPISVNEVLSYERTFRQMAMQAGLPTGFWNDREDAHQFLRSDQSLAEISEKIDLARQAMYQQPTEWRLAMTQLYGVSEGSLVAYWLDPNKAVPLLQRQMLAAQTATAAQLTKFGALTREEAERLGELGVQLDEATQGFENLYRQRELFQSLPGEGGEEVSREEQLAAQFSPDAAARERILTIARRRVAEFQTGSGGFATNREGFVGTGSATD